ncbi:MAG: 50S ribosomal protein L22 [Candidatus Yanofskybacteria bacterium RIFCSPHIGHO2_01_FULL_39_8b]|uniref:Large ribosomal subunit protein uL22 n=1 Tax=Candidatus Yanofskybacteria bacterium RIFCSPHIGHO2_01_FULL_39_8b TaxID=1802659 RepID=A0A1F8EAY9_9BACT|nr:MAG: 50S ribosomal protein L22 [Candidatus Yanofskybacteria bacterium RIFCSPHIGHO2_01_FULL_39_8b]
MSEVTAKLNNLRIAPRKVRAVVNMLKGKNVVEVIAQLEYYVRGSVEPIKKLINSAIANAENNFNMVKENLYVKEITVNEGIKLKRFRAKGFGRAAAIQKKTSHIKIVLDERTPGMRLEKKARVKKEIEETAIESKQYEDKKPEIKREIGRKGNVFGNLGKRLFQRKAI